MTASSLPGRAPGSRSRRIALIAALTVVVIAGVVVAVLTIPANHKAAAPLTPIRPSSAVTSPSASASPPTSSIAGTVPSSAPPTSSPASTDATAVLSQLVISGYLAFERTLNQQLSEAGPDTSPLLSVASGHVLANSEDAVAKLRGKGEVRRGNSIFTDIAVISIPSSTTAVVCAVEDDSPTEVVNAKTGAVVASGFQRYNTRTTMVFEDGAWKAEAAASVESC